MPYIGKGGNNGFGIRERYRYSASGSQTAFSGSDLDSKTLQFDSGSLLDVYLNGVLLDTADYNTSTANTITLTSGASASDEVMIVVYDVFSLSDAMPKTGGTFSGTLSGVDVNGTELILDEDADSSIHSSTDDQIDIKVGGNDTVIVAADSLKIRSDNAGLIFRRTTSEADIAKIQYVNGNPSLDIGADGKNVRFTNGGSYAEIMRVGTNGDVTVQNGNLVLGTNGKGIDFTAHSNVAGMTSELLDDYEEGSATVNMTSSGATFAFGGSDGSETTLYYVKIGRLVHYFMNWDSSSTVSGTTSNAVSITNLPFSSSYGDTFSVWFHRGGPGAVDIMPTAYSTSMSFMTSPTAGGMWSDMTAAALSHTDMRLRISGTTIVD